LKITEPTCALPKLRDLKPIRLRLESALDDRGVAQAQQTLLEIEKGIGYILLSRLLLDRASLPCPSW